MQEYTVARGLLDHYLVSSCTVRSQRADATYNVRNADKLSGRTTGRLGGIRQDTAHTIGWTTMLMTPGRPGAAGAWATPLHLPGPQDRQRGVQAGWSRVQQGLRWASDHGAWLCVVQCAPHSPTIWCRQLWQAGSCRDARTQVAHEARVALKHSRLAAIATHRMRNAKWHAVCTVQFLH